MKRHNANSDLTLSKNFTEFVRAAAAAYGDAIAIKLLGETIADDAISFRELVRKSTGVARGLKYEWMADG